MIKKVNHEEQGRMRGIVHELLWIFANTENPKEENTHDGVCINIDLSPVILLYFDLCSFYLSNNDDQLYIILRRHKNEKNTSYESDILNLIKRLEKISSSNFHIERNTEFSFIKEKLKKGLEFMSSGYFFLLKLESEKLNPCLLIK